MAEKHKAEKYKKGRKPKSRLGEKMALPVGFLTPEEKALIKAKQGNDSEQN